MTTATKSDIGLIKHLLRRASFGATPVELDHYEKLGYEAAVEKLIHPGDPQNMPDDIIKRYHTDMHELRYGNSASAYWALPHGDHQSSYGREGRALLARRIRHRVRQGPTKPAHSSTR